MSSRDLAETVGIAVVLTVLLGGGFYYLDFYNHGLVTGGVVPFNAETFVDAYIPFWPIWIWPYMAYFPLCFAPLVFAGKIERFRRIAFSYFLLYAPCLVFFALVPTRMIRPDFEVTDTTMAMMRFLYDLDPGYNIFPSLHCANTILIAWVFQRLAPRWAPPFWIMTVLIAFSTVFVKQHYLIDVPAGLALGSAAFFVGFRGVPAAPRADGPPAPPPPGDPPASG